MRVNHAASLRRLAALRRRIDRLDRGLRDLLRRRLAVAVRIGRVKRRLRLPVRDAGREAAVLRRVSRAARKAGMSARFLRRVFGLIMQESRRAQG